jgi:hypothetical protein
MKERFDRHKEGSIKANGKQAGDWTTHDATEKSSKSRSAHA